MKFGHFDDIAKEYVITNKSTPLPWINYLGNENFFGIISNTAGGYCFYKDARLRRLTRYRYNNVPLDVGGRYIYIRNAASGEFWSPTWQPTLTNLDDYYCRHGLGYTIIGSKYLGIEVEILYFVPLGENLEIWNMKIKNTNNIKVDLSIFSFIEFCLWDALDDATNYQRNFNTGEVEVDKNVIYHKTEYRERRNHFSFFSCSEELTGFDTQREKFFGQFNSWNNPEVVVKGESKNSIARGWSPVGSHHVKITLHEQESKTLIFLLGYYENPEDDKFTDFNCQILNKKYVLKVIEKFSSETNIEKSFQDLKSYWDELLGKFQVDTPNIHVNRMVNIWNQYQSLITFNLSRSASLYESGIGRGMGFRDSNQDILGFVHMIPEKAKEKILDLASTQFTDGGAYHQYQPLTKRGNHDIGSNFNDDPLWLIISVTKYIKETGDFNILDSKVPYNNQTGTEQPLYDHLESSLRYIWERRGPHGLPLIGRADWNDCLNLNAFSHNPDERFQTAVNKDGQTAESVFIAGLFIIAVNELIELFDIYFRGNKTDKYKNWAQEMKNCIYNYGCDGEWFLRAYDDFGNKIGSKDNIEGKIFIETQGICIMAGLGKENAIYTKALDSVSNRLVTPHGIVLVDPPFTKYYVHLGEISSYPSGYKENGSVFCHTNHWIMIAETKRGNGNQALDYYLRINPSARELISDIHRSEPYVYAQTIAGKNTINQGEAKNSWLTGASAWNLEAITCWILGINPTYYGLQICPTVPDDWSAFSVQRVFRNIKYNIDFHRIGKGNEVKIIVDGVELQSNIIPLPQNNVPLVNVSVELGCLEKVPLIQQEKAKQSKF